MARIELDDISKRFPDGTVAVQPTRLTIEDGEFFILVGPSGCGKSTLLNIMAGLTPPSSGEVRVDGRVVTGLDPRARNMAMVFQNYALYPHMTVGGNIAFPLRIAGVHREEMDRRVAAVAAMLELDELLERRPAELSGGQRQRVAMARAMVREPVAFLLDEPLSNLDARLRVQMRDELARLHRRLGTTMVYVTHDQTEAMTLGQRVAVLRAGRVQQVDSPRALYEAPANLFVAGFMGSPAMNILPAKVRRGSLVLPMVELPLPAPMRSLEEGHAVTAGLRPEAFGVAGGGETAMGETVFEVQVERVEWLGADGFIHFEVEDPGDHARHRLVARVDPTTRVVAGAPIRLSLDPERIHLFDARSGDRLALAANKAQ
ncbi:MAG: ABC transporter ATP-binding protein [Gammaproteobacteria bacterium]|nr:ABC transporter ATP-binding protein [Gammaproteobacteria bacterium]